MAGLGGFVEARLYEAVVISQHDARATLGLPTSTTGWIDDDVLADRIGAMDAAGRRPGRHEAVTALLRLRDPTALRGRLPRDGPTAAIAAAVDGDGSADPALRRALERATTLGALTFAADQQRPGLTRNVLPEADRPIMRWAPTLVPHATHLLAADARLDAVLLGRHLARLHSASIGASNRVGERLGPVADDAPVIAAGVRRAVQAWVASVEGLPRDLHHVLSLLEAATTTCGAGIDDTAARAVLERVATGRSERATIAGRLQALPATAPAQEPAQLAAAVLDRAERWTAAGAPGRPRAP